METIEVIPTFKSFSSIHYSWYDDHEIDEWKFNWFRNIDEEEHRFFGVKDGNTYVAFAHIVTNIRINELTTLDCEQRLPTHITDKKYVGIKYIISTKAGYGTKLMQDIVNEFCDDVLILEANGIDGRDDDLIKFFKRFDFEVFLNEPYRLMIKGLK